MKITDVKTFLIHPGTSKNWLFVKVETDEGIHGWGEAYTQSDRDRSIEITVQQLRRYLIGRSPFDIKHFTYMAYTDFATRRGSMEFYCAVSGIEHALWDIAGKATGSRSITCLVGQHARKFASMPMAGEAKASTSWSALPKTSWRAVLRR